MQNWDNFPPDGTQYTPTHCQDKNLGKFKEPLSLHKYLYCHNDPVNLVDPEGKFWGLIALIVGTTIGESCRRSDAYYKYAAYGYAVAAIGTIYELAIFWDLPHDIAEWLGIEDYVRKWEEEDYIHDDDEW